MLKENIKTLRTAKGLSQEELAEKLNVVRQTISKWEKGLSVPDAEQLIQMAECFEVSVGELLGCEIDAAERANAEEIAERLEKIKADLAKKNRKSRRALRIVSLVLLILTLMLLFMELAPFIRGEILFMMSTPSYSGSAGVIGGADGPTSIFITNVTPNWRGVAAIAAALAASVTGLVMSRK